MSAEAAAFAREVITAVAPQGRERAKNLLSGIGDEAQLREFGIPVHVHSPNVGENVQDHVLHGGCL